MCKSNIEIDKRRASDTEFGIPKRTNNRIKIYGNWNQWCSSGAIFFERISSCVVVHLCDVCVKNFNSKFDQRNSHFFRTTWIGLHSIFLFSFLALSHIPEHSLFEIHLNARTLTRKHTYVYTNFWWMKRPRIKSRQSKTTTKATKTDDDDDVQQYLKESERKK